MNRLGIAAFFGLVALTTASCGGAGGDLVRPNDITGSNALGGAKCADASKLAKPYVVDVAPALRVELEASMKRGVVVVAYDCNSLRVLPKCKVRGSYDYAGVSMKDQLIEMNNQDELNANIPLSAGKVGAELKSGNSINLALAFVGQRTTTLEKLNHDELSANCEGATHFITDASIGAFAMGQASAGKIGTAAELFKIGANASSSSSKKAQQSDGSFEACKTADPDAPKPPQQCQSAIMVTLQPLAGVPKPRSEAGTADGAPSASIDPCPTGFALVKGKCTKSAKACEPKSPTCLDDCNKGIPMACYNYAIYSAPKDNRAPWYKKACEGGELDACGWYVRQLYDGHGAPKELVDYSKKACKDGSATACTVLGDMLHATQSGPGADYKMGLKEHERGCTLGDWMGCTSAASYYRAFEPDNTKRTMELYERACTGSKDGDCSMLAKWLADPETKVRDPEAAAVAAKRECSVTPEMCEEMAVLMHEGLKSDKEAFKLAKAGCDFGADRCEQLGKFLWNGVGTAKDPAAAKQAWQKTCDAQTAKDPKNKWPACYFAKNGMQ